MTFIHPNPTHKDFREVNQHNLALLQKYDSEVQPLTKLAQSCFKEIDESRLGVGFYTRKYGVSALAFIGTLAVPVVGGSWALWQLVPRTPGAAIGTFGASVTAFFANKFAESFFKISPAKFIATLSRNAIVHAAGRVSDATLGSYRMHEEQTFKRHSELHKIMVTSLKETYDGMACELSSLYEEAKASPLKLITLKKNVRAIAHNLAHPKKAFSELGLQEATIHQITDDLEETIRRIDGVTLQLKADDSAYNKELLLTGSLDEVAIPQQALKALEEAKAHTLGKFFTATKYAASLGAAACGVGAVYLGVGSMKEPREIIGATAASLIAGACTYKLHDKKERDFAHIVADCREEAHVIVQEAYDAIGDYFLSATNKRALQKDARALKERLPQIAEVLARYEISSEVMLKLNQALDTIISPRKVTKTKATVSTRKSERLANKRVGEKGA